MKLPDDAAIVGELCPVCRQGRQFVMRDEADDQLFVGCEECDSEWAHPSQARQVSAAVRDAHPNSTIVRIAELRDHPWMCFVLDR